MTLAKLTEAQARKAVAMLEAGYSNATVALRFDVSKTTISRIWSKHLNEKEHDYAPG